MLLTFHAILTILVMIIVAKTASRTIYQVLLAKNSEIRFQDIQLIADCVHNLSKTYSAGRSLIFMSEQISTDLSETLVRGMNHGLKIISSVADVSQNIGFFLFFQDNRELSYIDILEKIPPNNVMRFVVIFNFQEKIDLRQIQKVFEEFWLYQIIDVIALVPFKISRNIRIYTYYPFSSMRCGETGPPMLINVWNSQKKAFLNQNDLFSRTKKVFNLYGCPLRCIGIHRPPESTITQLPDNTWHLSGTGNKVFKFIEKYMNFTAKIAVFQKVDQKKTFKNVSLRKWIGFAVINSFRVSDCISYTTNQIIMPINGPNLKNEYTYKQCRRQMKNGTNAALAGFDIAFGKFIRILDSEPNAEFITENIMDCFTWAVPHGIGRQPSIWTKYTIEFSATIWLMILFNIIITSILIRWIVGRLNVQSSDWQCYLFVLFYTFCTFIGATVKLKSKSTVLRLIVSEWLLYSLVITASYQAYMGSLMTVPRTEPEINKQTDLLNTSLNLIGRQEMFHVLNESATNSVEFHQLIDRFYIAPPTDLDIIINRMIEKRDIAMFTSKRELIYYAQRRRNTLNDKQEIHIFTDCVIKSYSSAFMLRKGSPFTHPVHRVLTRLFETGIYNNWDTDNVRDEIYHNIIISKETILVLKELYGAFVVLLGGLGLSSVVFFLEMFVKLIKDKQNRNNKEMKRFSK